MTIILKSALITGIVLVLALAVFSVGAFVINSDITGITGSTAESFYEDNDAFFISAESMGNVRHWNHMPLTYNYGSCAGTFEGRLAKDIDSAFEFYEQKTEGALEFVRIPDFEVADITFNCDIGNGPRELNFITEAEATEYIYTDTNVYSSGTIDVYASYQCLGERPTLLIHEIGHLLSLEHNTHPSYTNDIMHPYVRNNCDADLLEKDVDFLKGVYGGKVE